MTDFRQRRAIVDTLGWTHFQSWFYENSFRSWWQLNGLVGVPLYRIYKRKSDWKCGGPIEPAEDPDTENSINALSIGKYSKVFNKRTVHCSVRLLIS